MLHHISETLRVFEGYFRSALFVIIGIWRTTTITIVELDASNPKVSKYKLSGRTVLGPTKKLNRPHKNKLIVIIKPVWLTYLAKKGSMNHMMQ